MEQILKAKIPRKVLLLAFLVVGLVAVELDLNNGVSAKTCSEAYQDYQNADNTYYIARLSYINGSPTTCATQCARDLNPTACEQNCQTTRATAYYDAQLDLFSAASDTCAPEGIYYTCTDALEAANNCSVRYDYGSLTDEDEYAAVYAQYQACREASKVDTCQ